MTTIQMEFYREGLVDGLLVGIVIGLFVATIIWRGFYDEHTN